MVTIRGVAKAIIRSQADRIKQGVAADWQSAALDVKEIELLTQARLGRSVLHDADDQFYAMKDQIVGEAYAHSKVSAELKEYKAAQLKQILFGLN